MARRMLLATLLCLALPGSASAAKLVVTTEEDLRDRSCTVSECSLAGAIDAANRSLEADEIVFASDVVELELSGALPDIVGTAEVDGCAERPPEAEACVGIVTNASSLVRVTAPGVALAGLDLAGPGTGVTLSTGAEDVVIADSSFAGFETALLLGATGATVGANVFADNALAVDVRADSVEIVGNLFGPAAGLGNGRAIEVTGFSDPGPSGTLVAANFIGHSSGAGVVLDRATNSILRGNVLGREPDGAAAANTTGIEIRREATGSQLDDNEISHSRGDAIYIAQSNLFPNRNHLILANEGTGNGSGANDLFIDLGRDGPGVFPGEGVAAPDVTGVSSSSIAGMAEAGAAIRVFARPGRDPGDSGALLATTTAGGDGRFVASFATQAADTGVSATQTVPGAGTSELSVDPAAPPPPGPAPDTRLWNAGTTGVVNQRYAVFGFSSTLPGTFECSMDGKPFAPCEVGVHRELLADGRHVFAVRARSQAGVVDPTPATRVFFVDTRPPDTRVVAGPRPVANDPTPRLRFASTEPGGDVDCKLDRAAWLPCSFLPQIAEGSHLLRVRARDAVGNLDPTPLQIGFRVDLTAPRLGVAGQARHVRGALLVPTTCPKAEAAGPCRVRLVVRQGRKVLGRPSAVVRKGRTVLVRLRLKRPPKKGTRLTVAHTTTDAAGNRRSATARVRVR